MGADTGLASARSKVFEGLPTAGLPYQLSGWDDFERFMETLISAQTISTIREVWWDVRPHPNFGTVELRICDGLPTLFEIGWAAALSQCLVEMLNSQLDKGYTLPMPKGWTVRENKWRAARYGVDAEIILDDTGRTTPLRDALSELVDDLAPIAERLGCTDELARTKDILALGPSYARQRAVAHANDGDLTAVVDALVAEMRDNKPAVTAAS
jgi:carboxylate-amine ligase